MRSERDDPGEASDDDLHLCGRCKVTFSSIDTFIEHKKGCKAKAKSSVNDGLDEVNLATDEAAVISLLANQFSSHSSPDINFISTSQPGKQGQFIKQTGDDSLDQFTLVLDEELAKISQQPVPAKKQPDQQKCAGNSSRKKDQTVKTPVKTIPGGKNVHLCSVVGCKFAATHSKDLVRHMRTHTGEKPFSCGTCGKKFSRQDKVKNHERIHTGEKPYSCVLCPYTTADSGSLKKHVRIHTDARPFKCQICPYRSRDSSQLTVHLRTHTGDRPFVCPFEGCTSSFKTNSDLKRHSKTHWCNLCDFKAASKASMKAHIQHSHKESSCAAEEAGSSSGLNKCRTCDYRASNRESLVDHEKVHSLKCSHCDFKAVSRLALTTHVRKSHQVNLFKCEFCPFEAKVDAQLREHTRKRHGKVSPRSKRKDTPSPKKKRVVATDSPAKKASGSIKSHYYTCSICEAGFVRQDSLHSHMRQHQQRMQQTNPSKQSVPCDKGGVSPTNDHLSGRLNQTAGISVETPGFLTGQSDRAGDRVEQADYKHGFSDHISSTEPRERDKVDQKSGQVDHGSSKADQQSKLVSHKSSSSSYTDEHLSLKNELASHKSGFVSQKVSKVDHMDSSHCQKVDTMASNMVMRKTDAVLSSANSNVGDQAQLLFMTETGQSFLASNAHLVPSGSSNNLVNTSENVQYVITNGLGAPGATELQLVTASPSTHVILQPFVQR